MGSLLRRLAFGALCVSGGFGCAAHGRPGTGGDPLEGGAAARKCDRPPERALEKAIETVQHLKGWTIVALHPREGRLVCEVDPGGWNALERVELSVGADSAGGCVVEAHSQPEKSDSVRVFFEAFEARLQAP